MAFDVVITKHFEKYYLVSKIVTREMVVASAREIEAGIFYAGEGRVKGSKVLFKKRLKFSGQSKRRGGRILFVVFYQVKNVYVPYMVWRANDSKKEKIDRQLKDRKRVEEIIKKTIAFMSR